MSFVLMHRSLYIDAFVPTEEIGNIENYLNHSTLKEHLNNYKMPHFNKGDYKKVIRIGQAYRDAHIVMKQTTYTEKEAFDKLKEKIWNIEEVIR